MKQVSSVLLIQLKKKKVIFIRKNIEKLRGCDLGMNIKGCSLNDAIISTSHVLTIEI